MRTAHVPRKRFGQNFLKNQYVIENILHAIAPRREDRLVEIGPGLGALTTPLAAALNTLHVIEIDRDIVARLRQQFTAGHVIIHEGDALAFDFTALGPQLRVVGNLPYNISSPLLFHLATHAAAIRDIHAMLQKEVVERMVAAPGASDYGRLSVMLQYRFEMELVLEVGPDAFTPQPKVDSAVVRMLPRPPSGLNATDESVLARVVTAAFAQRRKTLRNTLRNVLGAADYAAVNIDPGARAQELSVADFVRVANYLAQSRAAG